MDRHGNSRPFLSLPGGLIEIGGVSADFIQRLWCRNLIQNQDLFESPPSESNIRLFNDVVRAALYENQPLPDISDVGPLVAGVIAFMLRGNTASPGDGSPDDQPGIHIPSRGGNFLRVSLEGILQGADFPEVDLEELVQVADHHRRDRTNLRHNGSVIDLGSGSLIEEEHQSLGSDPSRIRIAADRAGATGETPREVRSLDDLEALLLESSRQRSSRQAASGSSNVQADNSRSTVNSTVDLQRGSRLPYSLGALWPDPYEPHLHSRSWSTRIGMINLDGEDIVMSRDNLDELIGVDINGEAVLMTHEQYRFYQQPCRIFRFSQPHNHYGSNIQEDTYAILTGDPEDLRRRFIYGLGFHQSNDRRQYMSPSWFRRDRPRASLQYCDCNTYHGQSGEADLHRPYFPEAVEEQLIYRRDRAIQEAEGSGTALTLQTRYLFQQREARFLAGLDTSAFDREIARRILRSPESFGPLGEAMSDYVTELDRDGENYQLR